jgi:hypothetical protein
MKYLVEIDIDTDDRQAGEKRIIDLFHEAPVHEDDPALMSLLIFPDASGEGDGDGAKT